MFVAISSTVILADQQHNNWSCCWIKRLSNNSPERVYLFVARKRTLQSIRYLDRAKYQTLLGRHSQIFERYYCIGIFTSAKYTILFVIFVLSLSSKSQHRHPSVPKSSPVPELVLQDTETDPRALGLRAAPSTGFHSIYECFKGRVI